MHKSGFQRLDKFVCNQDAYDGISTRPFVNIIKKIIDVNECKSLLDYGCGKAKYYFKSFKTNKSNYPCLKDYWNIEINLFDPCYSKYNKLTKNKVDMTICIDVLEHIPNFDCLTNDSYNYHLLLENFKIINLNTQFIVRPTLVKL